jgi:DNA-binding CsgD family transcriptional regulator
MEELSNRERTVLSLLSRGYSQDEVGRELWITVNTVKFHVRNIRWKMEVKNTAHAVAVAYEEGILLPNGRLF